MIIETKHAEVTSNIPEGTGKRRQMKISEAGMAHIVGVLTKLYKDNELAVIRENFTNGVDAHARAGIKGVPVRVTLPTWDKPNYVVTDQGCGMSEDDLLDVYSQYGESTKLETNEEAGGFGIGAKSGLAIASQFTVVSVKDGFKSVGLITKETGLPEINVLSCQPTEEPNGTVVSIPVKDVYAFNAKANDFFQYVDPASVLVDGKTPKYALDAAEVITNPKYPDFKAYAKLNTASAWSSRGQSYLIMGNVPYQIPEDDVKTALGRDYNKVVTSNILSMTKYFMVPIGSVELTPNRESLMYTDKTNAVIKDFMEKFAESIKLNAQEKANAAADFIEYFKIKRQWKNACGWDLTYNGVQWEEEASVNKAVRRISRSVDGGSSHVTHYRVNYFEHDHQFFVTGLKADEYTKVNLYLTPFLRGRDLDDGVFLITEETAHLTDKRALTNKKIEIINFEDLIKEGKEQRKIDRANAVGKAEPKKLAYPVLVVADNEVKMIPYNEIPEGQPYAHQDESTESLQTVILGAYENLTYNKAGSSVTRVSNSVKNLTDFTHVTLVGRNRTTEAYLKRVPNSPNLNEIIREKLIPEYDALFTEEVKKVAAYKNSNWSNIFNRIGEDLTAKLADDTIASLVTPAKHVTEAIEKIKKMRTSLASVKYIYNLQNIEYIDDNKLVKELDRKYPLVSALDSHRQSKIPADHIVSYINSVQPINA